MSTETIKRAELTGRLVFLHPVFAKNPRSGNVPLLLPPCSPTLSCSSSWGTVSGVVSVTPGLLPGGSPSGVLHLWRFTVSTLAIWVDRHQFRGWPRSQWGSGPSWAYGESLKISGVIAPLTAAVSVLLVCAPN